MWLQFADELHGAYFRRTAQCSGGEGVDERLDRIGFAVQRAADAAHEVNDVAVILHLLVEIHFHVVAVAAEVVAGEVYQHHVLRVFFRVVVQVTGVYGILLRVAGALGSAGNGVYIGMASFDAAVRFGR